MKRTNTKFVRAKNNEGGEKREKQWPKSLLGAILVLVMIFNVTPVFNQVSAAEKSVFTIMKLSRDNFHDNCGPWVLYPTQAYKNAADGKTYCVDENLPWKVAKLTDAQLPEAVQKGLNWPQAGMQSYPKGNSLESIFFQMPIFSTGRIMMTFSKNGTATYYYFANDSWFIFTKGDVDKFLANFSSTKKIGEYYSLDMGPILGKECVIMHVQIVADTGEKINFYVNREVENPSDKELPVYPGNLQMIDPTQAVDLLEVKTDAKPLNAGTWAEIKPGEKRELLFEEPADGSVPKLKLDKFPEKVDGFMAVVLNEWNRAMIVTASSNGVTNESGLTILADKNVIANGWPFAGEQLTALLQQKLDQYSGDNAPDQVSERREEGVSYITLTWFNRQVSGVKFAVINWTLGNPIKDGGIGFDLSKITKAENLPEVVVKLLALNPAATTFETINTATGDAYYLDLSKGKTLDSRKVREILFEADYAACMLSQQLILTPDGKTLVRVTLDGSKTNHDGTANHVYVTFSSPLK